MEQQIQQVQVEELYEREFEQILLAQGLENIAKQEGDEKRGWMDYPEVIAC